MTRTFCLVLLLTLVAVSVLSFRATAQVLTTLHNFGDGSVVNDGFNPNGLILGRDGYFYGTTIGELATGANESGTVFKMTSSGAVTILHIFTPPTMGGDNSDGMSPRAALVQGSDGNFYGTTELGGSAGKGVIYKITPSGTFTTLHSFGDGTVANDGSGSFASLVQGTDGNFYGTTYYGGSTVSSSSSGLGWGTIFKIAPTGAYTVLHDFSDGSVPDDGAELSSALVQGSDGNFYGTTVQGGTGGAIGPTGVGTLGTVFKMTPEGAVTILHSFEGTPDGDLPEAALI